ncbi:MAG TPA: DMT family transporter [Mycobacteriales bacterium]|nr:DMT family transporter [Mycobacteriales bacterium]
MNGAAMAAALGSAACYAVASVAQHRTAGQAPPSRGLGLNLMASLIARPLWVTGSVAGAAGVGLQVYALGIGRLVVVQPLLVSGLLFALAASALLDRQQPSLRELAWAAVLAAGLLLFLLTAHPGGNQATPDADPAAIGIGAGIAATAAVALAGDRLWRRHRAFLLGLATGIAYGVTAVLIKYCLDLLSLGAGRLLTGWPLYVLIVFGGMLLVLNQAAYQAGPLAASLPPITIADPLVAIGLGVFAFGEHLTHTPAAIALQIAALLALTIASVALARRAGAALS